MIDPKAEQKLQLEIAKKAMMIEVADYIKENHVRVVHLFDKHRPKLGGVTVAYKPILHDTNGYPTGAAAYVSVAYCKAGDTYSRKIGETLAVDNMRNGSSIIMPIYSQKKPVLELKRIFKY